MPMKPASPDSACLLATTLFDERAKALSSFAFRNSRLEIVRFTDTETPVLREVGRAVSVGVLNYLIAPNVGERGRYR